MKKEKAKKEKKRGSKPKIKDMKVKVTDIVYDTDIDDDSTTFVLNSELPSEMIVEVNGIIDIESEIADAISDTPAPTTIYKVVV